jgi:hypothetical protein
VRILEDKGVTHVFTGKMKKESIKGSLLKEEGNRVLRMSAARMAQSWSRRFEHHGTRPASLHGAWRVQLQGVAA